MHVTIHLPHCYTRDDKVHATMTYPQVIELFRRLAVSGFVVLIPYE